MWEEVKSPSDFNKYNYTWAKCENGKIYIRKATTKELEYIRRKYGHI